jgi:hypothetical protein
MCAGWRLSCRIGWEKDQRLPSKQTIPDIMGGPQLLQTLCSVGYLIK